jgi:hypothetical protein
METLSIEERIRLSKTLGAPIDGILDKADIFIKQVEPLMRKLAEGPREAVILLAMAYLFYSISYSVDPEDERIIDRSKDFLDQVIGLIYLLGDH